LFSPGLFAGAIYNSNVFQTQNNRVSSWGERVVPYFSAQLNNGIYKTDVYGLVDVQNYSSQAARSTQIDAKAGVSQAYEARRDLTFRFSGDFTRQKDVFGSNAFVLSVPNSTTSPGLTAPVTVSPQANPDHYNQYSGSAVMEKQFNRAFASLGANVTSTTFDSNFVDRNGTIYTIAERTGYHLTPQIYGFIDPSYSWQRYAISSRDSDGYRVTAGFGTNRAGIWQGEVFGGYQAQRNAVLGTFSSDVFGTRIIYSPTRMWTLTASVDETLGATTFLPKGIGGPTLTATASRVTSALATVIYNGMPQNWGTNARVGYVRTVLIGNPRVDDAWLAGANVSYNFWRNWGLTLDYQYKVVKSNTADASFDDHTVSMGVSYKY
jgi:hypothetical protein